MFYFLNGRGLHNSSPTLDVILQRHGEIRKSWRAYTIFTRENCVILNLHTLGLIDVMLIDTLPNSPVTFSFEILDFPDILNHAKTKLNQTGILKHEKTSSYCYLKVADEYILDLFPLLQAKIKQKELIMPDYFSDEKNHMGAHISLVYPTEKNARTISTHLESNNTFPSCHFTVNHLISISTMKKSFYALTVSCNALDEIRAQHGFSQKLNYYGLLVPFHITIGIVKA